MYFLDLFKVAGIIGFELKRKGTAKSTRANLHVETDQWASGPCGLPRERGLVKIETKSRSSRWPAEIGNRRRYRVPAGSYGCASERGQRGEHNGGGAAP
jgi:hypothetical protein